jgi:hypothetical protein
VVQLRDLCSLKFNLITIYLQLRRPRFTRSRRHDVTYYYLAAIKYSLDSLAYDVGNPTRTGDCSNFGSSFQLQTSQSGSFRRSGYLSVSLVEPCLRMERTIGNASSQHVPIGHCSFERLCQGSLFRRRP